jgi:hypothetical protein
VKVVCNASPLINLARVGQLSLLSRLFGRVLLPEAVWHEVVEEGQGQPGGGEIGEAAWIDRRVVANRQLTHSLRQDLDPGEAEAIALAVEIEADLLLMDERLGRETARHFGLRCLGLIGVMCAAKQRGYLVALKPFLEQLRDSAGFWISSALYGQVLRDAGEAGAPAASRRQPS